MSYFDYSNLTAPENAHTLSEFVTAGKTHAENRYVDFCYMEKLGSINFVVRNILRDYIEELKEETIECTLSLEEQLKYRYNPKHLALDIYGSTDLYFIILMLNDMIDVREFRDIHKIRLLRRSTLMDMISKINTSERINLEKYNAKHSHL